MDQKQHSEPTKTTTTPEKWFKYSSLDGTATQVNGINLPLDGLYSRSRIPKLDELIGVGCTMERADPPGREDGKPTLQIDKDASDQVGTQVAIQQRPGDKKPEKVYEFTEATFRSLPKKDREEYCRKVAVNSNQSLDAIVNELKVKELIGPKV